MFRKHSDEQRLDVDEGTISILCRANESSREPILVQALVGTDAYVLSTCLVPSTDVMKDFNADSAIVIRDPVGFALAISNAIPDFNHGFDGPCSYQSRRFVYGDLSRLNAPPEVLEAFRTEASDSAYPARMAGLIAAVAQRDPYFMKHYKYVSQNEWRFIWLVDHLNEDVLFVTSPEARQFCEPWSNSTNFVAFDRNGPLPPPSE